MRVSSFTVIVSSYEREVEVTVDVSNNKVDFDGPVTVEQLQEVARFIAEYMPDEQ